MDKEEQPQVALNAAAILQAQQNRVNEVMHSLRQQQVKLLASTVAEVLAIVDEDDF